MPEFWRRSRPAATGPPGSVARSMARVSQGRREAHHWRQQNWRRHRVGASAWRSALVPRSCVPRHWRSRLKQFGRVCPVPLGARRRPRLWRKKHAPRNGNWLRAGPRRRSWRPGGGRISQSRPAPIRPEYRLVRRELCNDRRANGQDRHCRSASSRMDARPLLRPCRRSGRAGQDAFHDCHLASVLALTLQFWAGFRYQELKIGATALYLVCGWRETLANAGVGSGVMVGNNKHRMRSIDRPDEAS